MTHFRALFAAEELAKEIAAWKTMSLFDDNSFNQHEQNAGPEPSDSQPAGSTSVEPIILPLAAGWPGKA